MIQSDSNVSLSFNILNEKSLKENFVFFRITISSQSSIKNIFAKLDLFMESHNIYWENSINVFSGGERAMTGKHDCVFAKVTEIALDLKLFITAFIVQL